MNISEKIKQCRKEKKLTQSNLAVKTGVTEQYIYMIEANERTPSVKVAKKIASILGFNWTEFYKDEYKEGA